MARPRGTYGSHRRRAEETFVQADFDPLQAKIEHAKVLRSKCVLSEAREDGQEVHWNAIYERCLENLCGYLHPRLKPVPYVEEDRPEPDRGNAQIQILMLQRAASVLGYRLVARGEDPSFGLQSEDPALIGAPRNGGGA